MLRAVQQMHPTPTVSGTAQKGSLNLVAEKLHRSTHQQSAAHDADLDLRLVGNATTMAVQQAPVRHIQRTAGCL
jgi:isochorismate synthase EntC